METIIITIVFYRRVRPVFNLASRNFLVVSRALVVPLSVVKWSVIIIDVPTLFLHMFGFPGKLSRVVPGPLMI